MKPVRLPLANLLWLIAFWAIAHAGVVLHLSFPSALRPIAFAMIGSFAFSTFVFCVYVRRIELPAPADRLFAVVCLIFNMAFLAETSDLGATLSSEVQPVGVLLVIFWAYGMKAVWDQLRDAYR